MYLLGLQYSHDQQFLASNKDYSMRLSKSVLLLVLLSGCANTYEPIVEQQYIDPAKYNRDLYECRSYADQVDMTKEAGQDTIVGGILGAALGAAAGAFSGQAALGAASGGALGAVVGGGSGALDANTRKVKVIRRCLTARGYTVYD